MLSYAGAINPLPIFQLVTVKIDQAGVDLPFLRKKAPGKPFLGNELDTVYELPQERRIGLGPQTAVKSPLGRMIVVQARELPVT
jgi:hypothetical protein